MLTRKKTIALALLAAAMPAASQALTLNAGTSAEPSSLVTKVQTFFGYDYNNRPQQAPSYSHSRWRSHYRWGSSSVLDSDDDHSRYRSHYRWGSQREQSDDEHSRWRSHWRWGSESYYRRNHVRGRSHYRWASRALRDKS